MQVFKVFLKVLRKNLPTAMIYVAVFLAVAIGVTMAGDPSEKFTAVKMNICIFDEDDTPESRALTELLTQGNKRVYLDNNTESITDALYYETANMVITINKGFAEKLAAGETDGLFSTKSMHTSYSVVNMKQSLTQYVSTVSAYMAAGKDFSSAAEAAKQSLSEKVQVTLVSEKEGASSDFVNYFRYLPYILISVMINSLCPTIMAMNKRDVRYRTNCSSVKASSVTLQTFLGSAVFVLAIWLLFNIVSLFICGNAYNGVGWLALLNSLIFAVISAIIAILVASLNVSINVVNLITQVIGLGMSFLCGVFVEMDMLDEKVQAAARFLPAYWYVRANNMIGGGEKFIGSDVALFLLIETGFAVALFVITLLIRRMKYNSAENLSA